MDLKTKIVASVGALTVATTPLTTLAEEKDEHIEKLIAQMNVVEKVGQLNLPGVGAALAKQDQLAKLKKDIHSGRIGNLSNVFNFEGKRMLQREAVENSRHGIPLLFATDVIHGYKTIFPIPLGEAASWNIEAMEQSARVAAREASAAGEAWTYAPMVDVSHDPRWGRNMEGAGEDPYLSSLVAAARVRGFQGDDLSQPDTILACMKHYVGYGDVQAGRDYHAVDMSERRLREFHLPPFKAAVEAGVESTMSAFNEINGIPSTTNSYLLRDILRDEWGFEGFVVSDYTAIEELIHHGTVKDAADAALQSLEAGIDMDMVSDVYVDELPALVKSGKVDMKLLDDAVRNVLRVKKKLGLFDDPYRYLDTARFKELNEASIDSDLAYQLAAESLVLLQNENQVLPLSAGKNIAVVGPLAEAKRDLLGWAICTGKWEDMETVKEGIERNNKGGNVIYAKGCDFDDDDRSGFAEALEAAKQSDVVVMVLGEAWAMSGEATSRSDITIPGVQTELLAEIKKLGKPIALVVMNGRALALQDESELADAILEAWYPGNEGGKAVADTLFGHNNPQGKLPVTFPRSVGQIPIHYDMKNGGRPQDPNDLKNRWVSRYTDILNTPLYPFGHGLSYTTFEYADAKMSSETMDSGGSVELTVQLSNTGEREGTEIAQLYIRDLVASVTRPVRQLKGFQRVALKPGESKTLSFTIDEEMLSFYRRDMSWGTEPGEFQVFVGGSSDAELMTSFTLTE
ncbi:glycoside hydrolase family 3 N-terminal domain-containing protein [Persicirhabdus sediminis]|uniref:Glycoside hydrolase family 3 C-terminal domain-containing protein n=1 Tax=Persicirhabdus sediminis TaxID=454144 RepID=A0A8J7SG64_9BACT|nr:glycoside hydrolase family 3 N-terminal domain-containing protein [Persicirhabdus sediminis]MBK1789915.1 glycoside hydrolase family 3 C-terminal domain-containing protein [Persicirhabdus sediminis]